MNIIPQAPAQSALLLADLSVPTGELIPPLPTEALTTLRLLLQSYGGDLRPAPAPTLLLAYFSGQDAGPQAGRQAVRAALALRDELRVQRRMTAGRTGFLPLRLALTLVPAAATPADEAEALAALQTALGEAGPGELLATAPLHAAVGGLFEVSERPTGYIRFHGERAPATAPTREEGTAQAPMVGRSEALAALKSAFVEVSAQEELRIVTVRGETGIGKSRLLQAFVSWVEQRPETVRFFKGRANSHLSSQPYALMRDLFSYRFGIQERDSSATIRAKMEQGVRSAISSEATEKAHFLGQLLGFDFSDSPYLRSVLNDARQMRERAFHYSTLFFNAMTTERSRAVRLMRTSSGHTDRPIVALLLDDVHWADSGSLEMLLHLAERGATMPMLIVALARPLLWERFPAWESLLPPNLHRVVPLEPLSESELGDVAAELLAPLRPPSPALQARLTAQAQGSPYHLQQLVALLEEEGVLRRDGHGHWTLSTPNPAMLWLPPTLPALLRARLDALPHAERECLRTASVMGRVFWEGALTAAGGDSVRSQPTACLQGLQARGHIIERRTSAFHSTREFVFAQPLLQEVAYETLAPQQRRTMHARVAQWLTEQVNPEGMLWAGQIGEHFDKAGQSPEAALWFERVGLLAREGYAFSDAIEHFERALALIGPEGQPMRRAILHEGIGVMAQQQARYSEAASAFEAMHELAVEGAQPIVEARAWARLSDLHTKQGDFRAALRAAEQAQALARALGEEAQGVLAQALFSEGWAWMRLGEMERAFVLGEEALALSRAVMARDVVAQSLKLLGSILTTQGHRFDEATGYFNQAIALYRNLGDSQGEALLLNNLGVLAFKQGDYHSAVARYAGALAIAERTGSRDVEGLVRDNLGEAYVGLGDFEGAEQELRGAIEMAEGAGRGEFAAIAYSFLGRALLGQGRFEEALAAAEQALAHAQKSGERRHLAHAWHTVARLMAHAKLPRALARHNSNAAFEQSVKGFEAIGAHGEQARALRTWAYHLLAQGDAEQAEAMWRAAYSHFERLGMTPELERMTHWPPYSEERSTP